MTLCYNKALFHPRLFFHVQTSCYSPADAVYRKCQCRVTCRYMQTIENAAVWAQIGDKMVTVGNIRAGQIIAVEPTASGLLRI